MIDKTYCMSSYLAFRYIVDDEKEFYHKTSHCNYCLLAEEQRIRVRSAEEIDGVIAEQMKVLKSEELGILLSGGMDSAILAAYMPGRKAYTFRFSGGNWQEDELKRAERYAQYYDLDLHYVDINWDTIQAHIDATMLAKGAPVHSIEPQIVQAALQAKEDGVERIIIGDAADYIFGGMDKLLSKDWGFDEFIRRYIYINPKDVLVDSVDMTYIFGEYRRGKNIDFVAFLEKYASIESYGSYKNAFDTAKMPYTDLYEVLQLDGELDLSRIRNGESKYLIRELFKMKYPEISVPEKNPMPRPVDAYFANWEGPTRPEFRKNLNMKDFTGNQKWLMYCLERFLNLHEKI